MLFNSIDFAIFLPIVFILYWFSTNNNLKRQNFLIVVASYIFYGWWDWKFLSPSLFSIPKIAEMSSALTTIVLVAIFVLIEWKGRKGQYAIAHIALECKRPVRYALYYAIIIAIFWFGGKEQQFIYFQF